MLSQRLEPAEFSALLNQHLLVLYPEHSTAALLQQILQIFDHRLTDEPATADGPVPDESPAPQHLWSAEDSLLITYADTLQQAGEVPLQTLRRFLTDHVGSAISAVHVLPFCPFSSDDGFAVIDYTAVNPELGTWDDLQQIAGEYRLMADLVINHVSSQSEWFQNYCAGRDPGAGYFVEASLTDDLSQVVRPRASPLLRPTETVHGLTHLWCTFSHDQIDLNFRNPDVLLEVLKVVRLYLQHGVRQLRLDAIGYLWKESGTPSIHLPQTHEVVRLLRTVVDYYAPGTILITETNVPNHENLSYFGNRNEAHMIYNFSLAPLLVHALLTGKTEYLKRWMMSMPPAPVGCTYLNFTASHDGIGMRPAEGLLSDEEQFQMIETIRRFGGQVSTRRGANGEERVYELNVSLFDALQGTVAGPDDAQVQRFLCSQTVMMAVEGVPAFYIHSLLATPNDAAGVARTGHNRSINRHIWDYAELEQRLSDPESAESVVFRELHRLLQIRRRQPAFSPDATQFTLQLGAPFFAFWRQSMDRAQSIFAIHNMTDEPQRLPLSDLNLITLNRWHDAISGQTYDDLRGMLEVQPYQCLWITNHADG
ncbi:MAG: sugar phosphorylase [Fuerstiella sp.]